MEQKLLNNAFVIAMPTLMVGVAIIKEVCHYNN